MPRHELGMLCYFLLGWATETDLLYLANVVCMCHVQFHADSLPEHKARVRFFWVALLYGVYYM